MRTDRKNLNAKPRLIKKKLMKKIIEMGCLTEDIFNIMRMGIIKYKRVIGKGNLNPNILTIRTGSKNLKIILLL